jgi:rod shape determining protein RodA
MTFDDFKRMARRTILVFDPILTVTLILILILSVMTVYSAGVNFPGRFEVHLRNILVAALVCWGAANLPPNWMRGTAVPIYVLGIVLLIGVALFGDVSKGARRWLNLGVTRIQPSELLKIATPLMLAWWFHRREGALRAIDFLVSAALLMLPTLLIARQPDLGTAVLVFAAGAYVIFFAGFPWKLLTALGVGMTAATPLLWMAMHDYQRQRVLTLIDPSSDPLGKGFHIIQSTIAVGSGGLWGKGWLQGTQAHLEFIPESTTDFVFAVFAEEFGLVGNLILLVLYLALMLRGLMIAASGATMFMRLLAGSITMIFFTYAFVNMGMVSGILPVVGVPLPWMSYGGTAMVTLGLGAGLLMSIQRHRKLVQT